MRPGPPDPAFAPVPRSTAVTDEPEDPTEPVEVPSEGTPGRRRLGFGLTFFGATGLLLFGVAMAYVAGPLGGENGPFGLEGQRRQLVAMLDASATVVEDARIAVTGANDSLGETAEAAASAGGFMTSLGATMQAAAQALRVNVLGSQPFAGVAASFEQVAGQAAAVAIDLESAAASVASARDELATLGDDLGELRRKLDDIRGGFTSPIAAGRWRLIAIAVLGWFAIPALVSLLIGFRWLRGADRPPAGPRRATTPATRTRPTLPRRG